MLYLPKAVGAAEVAEVSVGRHDGVGLTARNDGGCRRDCREQETYNIGYYMSTHDAPPLYRMFIKLSVIDMVIQGGFSFVFFGD